MFRKERLKVFPPGIDGCFQKTSENERPKASPDEFDIVRSELLVHRDEWERLHLGLGDDEAVERVPVVEGKGRRPTPS